MADRRLFAGDVPCRVKMIRVCQRIGLSVSEIRRRMETLPDDPQPQDWESLGARLEEEVRERIDGLRAVLADLSSEGLLCELPPLEANRSGSAA